MKRLWSICLLSMWAAHAMGQTETSSLVAGWDSHDGLTLLGELNCVGCHQAEDAVAKGLLTKQPPILSEVGGRVTPQYLRRFLANPQHGKPGSTMPAVLKEGDKDAVEALTHYLASLGKPIDQFASGASLSQIEQGKALYHSIGCTACHQPFDKPPQHKLDPSTQAALELQQEDSDPKPYIPLGDLSRKTTVEALAKFLDNPLHVRPSGRMPKLATQPGEANFLAAYLLRDQYREDQTAPGSGLSRSYYEGSWSNVPDFDKLTPLVEDRSDNFDLKALKNAQGQPPKSNFAVRFQGLLQVPADGEYQFWTRSDDASVLRVNGQIVVNNNGAHPPTERNGKIRLTAGNKPIELGFTQVGGGFELNNVHWQPPGGKRSPIPNGLLLHSAGAMIPKDAEKFQPNPDLVQRGEALFRKSGCIRCHEVKQTAKPDLAAIKPLKQLDPNAAGGCLSASPAEGRPRYALSDVQRKALQTTVTALKEKAPASDAAAKIDQHMKSFNCYNCHARNGKGGPEPRRHPYFVYERVVDLGDEGRMPPALNEVGAKLTDEGFEDALFQGSKYRTYMAARMPQFGKQNLHHLPAVFRQADAGKIPARTVPKLTSRLVDDGRKLVGKKHLACVNCHAWGDLHLPGAEGMDLQKVTRRVKPEWFHALLENPQRLRPRTRMPTSWPRGKSFFQDIQKGDMHKQIDAVWTYLSVREKGGAPNGLQPDDKTMLTPVDEPIVFRSFLNGISSHAILVGFRQRTHVAFDANRIKMAAAWTGDFVSTKYSWDGRAGQYAPIPSNNTLRFPEGPAFAFLESPAQSWPKEAPKKKLGSRRTPEGWRFLGYRFDRERVPTFLYRIQGIEVEERPSAELDPELASLRRKFVLRSKTEPKNLYLMLAASSKIEEKDGVYVLEGSPAARVSMISSQRPNIRQADNRQELVLPVKLKPQDGQFVAEIEIQWNW